MPAKKTRWTIPISVRWETRSFYRALIDQKENASEVFDDIIQASPEFQKRLKEQNEKTLGDIGWKNKQETS